MKKTLCSILSAIIVACSLPSIVYADEDIAQQETTAYTGPIELSGECGYPSYVDIYLYVSEDNNQVINYLNFFNLDTKQEYFVEFNNYNYEDSHLWTERINFPNGRYAISARVAGDTYGAFRLHTDPETLLVSDNSQSLMCILGMSGWVSENVELLNPAPTEAPEEIAPTEAPTPLPTIPPHVDEVVEAPEPQESSPNYIPLIAVGAVVIVLAFLFLKKKR